MDREVNREVNREVDEENEENARIRAQYEALLPGPRAQHACAHLKGRLTRLLRRVQPGRLRQVNQRVAVLAEQAALADATARHFANFVDYVIRLAQDNPEIIINEVNDYRADRVYPQQPY